MKPITKKVIEAGLVPKHTILLMQRWGYLEPEASDIPTMQADLKEGFIQFVEDLEELIEEEAEKDIQETKFSITLRDPFLVYWIGDAKPRSVIVFKDESGHLIFPASEGVRLGDIFQTAETKELQEIISVVRLWSGSDIVAYQVDVRSIR